MSTERLVRRLLQKCYKTELFAFYEGPVFHDANDFKQEILDLYNKVEAKSFQSPHANVAGEPLDIRFTEPRKLPERHGCFVIKDVYIHMASVKPKEDDMMLHMRPPEHDFVFEPIAAPDHPWYADLHRILAEAHYTLNKNFPRRVA